MATLPMKRLFSLDSNECNTSTGKQGPKDKSFSDLRHRSKLRRTESLRNKTASEELLFATVSVLYKETI